MFSSCDSDSETPTLQDLGMEKGNSLEVIDSTNNASDLENIGKSEDPETESNIPLLLDITDASPNDNCENNDDVTDQGNDQSDQSGSREVNSGRYFVFICGLSVQK